MLPPTGRNMTHKSYSPLILMTYRSIFVRGAGLRMCAKT